MGIINVGDWVSFYFGGAIVIGEVRYIRTRIGGYVELCTHKGVVDATSVLEVRRGAFAVDVS